MRTRYVNIEGQAQQVPVIKAGKPNEFALIELEVSQLCRQAAREAQEDTQDEVLIHDVDYFPLPEYDHGLLEDIPF